MNALASAADETPDDAVEEARTLYREHAQALHRTLRRLAPPSVDAADLLQDVFVVALRRAAAVRAAESPRAWLFGVALKLAGDARRRAGLRRFFGLDALSGHAMAETPATHAERSDEAHRVQAALDRLSAVKREVLILFELEGLTGPEIAAAVGCPVATVWTRLHHARRELEVSLGGKR